MEHDKLDAKILGQLLLMQSIVINLPDNKSVYSFICKGLQDIPGTMDVTFSSGNSDKTTHSDSRLNLPIIQNKTEYGMLEISLNNPEAFSPYLDYVKNFVFMLGVIFEERHQRQEIKKQHEELKVALKKWKETSEELDVMNTNLYESNKALAISEKKYRLLAENSTDVIWLYNIAHQRYDYLSPSIYLLSGYTIAERMKLSLDDRFTPTSALKLRELLTSKSDEVLEDREIFLKKKFVYELEQKCKNGLIKWIEISANFQINEENEVLILGISRDIDQRKKAEKELNISREKLVESDKMASLGILTAGISHEINNPLNFIMGSYKGLTYYFDEFSSQNEKVTSALLNSIKVGIDRISTIVKSLNLFSLDDSNCDDAYNLHVILDNCLVILNSQIKYKAKITKRYLDEKIIIKGNIGKLQQAFTNVLTNSIQAIDQNGVIEISTNKTTDNKVEISISDNGHGIKNTLIKKITEPFFTTKPPGMGTGLGLSITYAIIKEHGGTLKFESEEGVGTKVIIKIPMQAPSQHVPPRIGKLEKDKV